MRTPCRLSFWPVAVIALAAAAGALILSTRPTQLPRAPAPSAPAPATARPAPDFRLRGFDGRLIALSDFRGKIVVLNFWASWCTPCKQEMPNLERVWREFRDEGVVVLGVDVLDDPEDAKAFLTALRITYPNVHDPEEGRMIAYRVTGLPTTIFIDRNQLIRGRFVGGYLGPTGHEALRRQIRELLSESPPE